MLSVVNISEDASLTTALLKAIATDNDVGMAGQVKYYITSFNDTFNITTDSGKVTLVKGLDREKKENYTLVIQASDSAPSPFELTKSHTVVVTVLDVNDNSPKFGATVKDYVVDETAPAGSVLFNLDATDADSGLNSKIVYSILSSSNITNLFKLIPENGSFVANGK